MMRKFAGYLVFPFLFGKTGIFMAAAAAFVIGSHESLLIFAFAYCLFFNGVIGNTGILECVLDGIIRFLKINYYRKQVNNHWKDLSGGTVWSFPIICINGKDHEFTLAEMGGNRYPPAARLKRKIITAYLFSRVKASEPDYQLNK